MFHCVSETQTNTSAITHVHYSLTPADENAYTVICVDDEISVLEALREELERGLDERFSIEIAESGAEALELIEELNAEGVCIPVIISDHLMPRMRGDVLLTEVEKRLPGTRKILLSGQAPEEDLLQIRRNLQRFHFLHKPWNAQKLRSLIYHAIHEEPTT